MRSREYFWALYYAVEFHKRNSVQLSSGSRLGIGSDRELLNARGPYSDTVKTIQLVPLPAYLRLVLDLFGTRAAALPARSRDWLYDLFFGLRPSTITYC